MPDRRVASYPRQHLGLRFLVKWKGLGHADATWETAASLTKSDADKAAVAKFYTTQERCRKRVLKAKGEAGSGGGGGGGKGTSQKRGGGSSASLSSLARKGSGSRMVIDDEEEDDEGDKVEGGDGDEKEEQKEEEEEEDSDDEEVVLDPKAVPTFRNDRTLRDYQVTSLEWMITHWANYRNCILGDEMGLGKTAQSIAVLSYQRQFGKREGPFLVIAPLTTLGHWQREIETWTDMDVVLYAGTAADRLTIQRHDLFIPGSTVMVGYGKNKRPMKLVKPNIVLASYETVRGDAAVFGSIRWESVVIDEAHRMKTVGSSTRAVISSLDMNWLLLLTGTPVQNNMRELFGLMNLLDRKRYSSEAAFLEEYGDDRNGMTPAQVRKLQVALKPVLLRRMKEDVETLPEKEECIIWTQLTQDQRAYYKAIFERQIGTLLGGSGQKNVPNLRNLAMELRKVCCHPFLCDGLEEDIRQRRANSSNEALSEVDHLVNSSGKMLLLHKLLPKLKAEGHKVLIFSQFKIMLDVLEDYMKASNYPVERIDGSITGRERQLAIDRFSKEGSDGFVFLLSTRAGGQGITLTAADTCIIYDSDWNPQNDLQAMARCHRIGQDKDVTIYRLVSKNTYEEHVFRTSSRKYGLDEAILGGIGSGGRSGGGAGGSDGNGEEMDGKKIADLLKHGAHCLDQVEEAAAETNAFANEDIDEILKGRTEKRQIGARAGNTFSVATFEVAGGGTGGGATATNSGAAGSDGDEAFWSTLLPEAAARHAEAKRAAAQGHILLQPRQKKRINYAEGLIRRRRKRSSSSDDGGEGGGDDDDDDEDFVADEGMDGGADDSVGYRTSSPAINSDDGGDSGAGEAGGEGKKRRKLEPSGPVTGRKWTPTMMNAFFDKLLYYGFSPRGIIRAATALKINARSGYVMEDVPHVAAVLRAMLERGVRVEGRTHVRSLNESALQKELRPEVEKECREDEGKKMLGPEEFQRVVDEETVARAAREWQVLRKTASAWDAIIASVTKTLAVDVVKESEEKKEEGEEQPSNPKVKLLMPAAAMMALQDDRLADRIVRSGPTFYAHVRQMDALVEWEEEYYGGESESGGKEGKVEAPLRMLLHDKGVPHWWQREHDTQLLLGVLKHGWSLRRQQENIQAILTDPEFGFVQRVVEGSGDGGDGITPVVDWGGNTNNTNNKNNKGDSFQVRPSPNGSNAVAKLPDGNGGGGGGAQDVPPTVMNRKEWKAFKLALQHIVQDLISRMQMKKRFGSGSGATDADGQSNLSPLFDRKPGMKKNRNSGGGGSGGLLQRVLKKEASKQAKIEEETEGEDPIERFSEGETEREQRLQGKKKSKKKSEVDVKKTPLDATVPALNVFEETRGGKFTGTGSGKRKGEGEEGGASMSLKKKKVGGGGGGAGGKQKSLLEMKFYKQQGKEEERAPESNDEDASVIIE